MIIRDLDELSYGLSRIACGGQQTQACTWIPAARVLVIFAYFHCLYMYPTFGGTWETKWKCDLNINHFVFYPLSEKYRCG